MKKKINTVASVSGKQDFFEALGSDIWPTYCGWTNYRLSAGPFSLRFKHRHFTCVCQRLRACTRWARTAAQPARHALVLPICRRTQQFAHWHSSTPVGHTSGLGPKPFHPSRNISERQEPVSKWSNAYLMHATGVMSSPLAKEWGCL